MSAPDPRERLDRAGVAATAGAFVIWGLFPLYWRLLAQVPSLQIIAHRIVWSALLVVGWLLARDRLRWWRALSAVPRARSTLLLTALLIAFNWGLYIWAVNAGHVVESSLGYFINPLVNVLLGVLVLKERLRPLQWLAVAIAALGVAWLTWQAGRPPWIALGLAASFGVYGLLRKQVAVEAMAGLGAESVFLFLPALAFLTWCEAGHGGGFLHGTANGGWGAGADLLLVLGGAVTAVPLIGFSFGVRRIPLSLVGLFQYIAPTLQFLIGVGLFHEAFDAVHALGFAAIWAGLLLFAGEGLWRARRRH